MRQVGWNPVQPCAQCSWARSLGRRPIFIHLQCWELLPLLTIQRQWCIKFRVLRAQDFYTPLARNCPKGQHLPALEVYKNQSPIIGDLFTFSEYVPRISWGMIRELSHFWENHCLLRVNFLPFSFLGFHRGTFSQNIQSFVEALLGEAWGQTHGLLRKAMLIVSLRLETLQSQYLSFFLSCMLRRKYSQSSPQFLRTSRALFPGIFCFAKSSGESVAKIHAKCLSEKAREFLQVISKNHCRQLKSACLEGCCRCERM